MRTSPLLMLVLAACQTEPMPLPTAAEAAAADARVEQAARPPLTQVLYDYALAPDLQAREQRVRLLIWLKHMELGDYQLRALAELHVQAEAERARIDAAQAELLAASEPTLTATYDALWAKLSAGASLDDPALAEAAAPLIDARKHHERADALLALRLQGVKAVLEAERPWLATLSPKQEALLTDSLFALRHKLDPYANPGDFKALVGTVFSAGEYGTLTRGSFTQTDDQLDLSRLWSDYTKAEVNGPVFNNARRELILYMLLMEPTLPEAIQAALGAAAPATPAPPNPPSDG